MMDAHRLRHLLCSREEIDTDDLDDSKSEDEKENNACLQSGRR